MNTMINAMSFISVFIFGMGGIYIFVDVTAGKIKLFHPKSEWHGLQVKDSVFIIVSAAAMPSIHSSIINKILQF